MHTLTPDQLAHLLRQSAAGSYADEAAIELSIAHGSWLRRSDFLTACVNYDHDRNHPVAWIDFDTVNDFLVRAGCSSSEARILRLAAELAGVDTGHPLAELLSSLDDTNSALVVDAIAHALHLDRRPEWLAALGGTLVPHDTTTWGRAR
jgi:hypothetical protein